MTTIDFRKVSVLDIEGNETMVDISKELGNFMYLNATDIAEADLGHDIYHKGEVGLSGQQAGLVAGYVDKGFKAIVKKSLLPVLNAVTD